MIANRPDWCISRQRSWGVPLPFFLHKDTGELHPRTMEIMDQAAEHRRARRHRGLEPRHHRRHPGAEDAPHYTQEPGHPGSVVRLGLAPSGTCCAARTPACTTTKAPRPTSYLEGHGPAPGLVPQLARCWPAPSLAAPRTGLLTHGFTVDGQGKKMSKSLGNTVSPQEVSSKMGAEIIRLWCASTDYSGDLAMTTRSWPAWSMPTAASATRCAFCWPTPATSTPPRMPCPTDDCWKSTAGRWRVPPQFQAEVLAPLQGLRIPPRGAPSCAVLLRGLGRLLPGRAQDRLYTSAAGSLARRSAPDGTAPDPARRCCAGWHRSWSFTAEEAWKLCRRSSNSMLFGNLPHPACRRRGPAGQVGAHPRASARWRTRKLKTSARPAHVGASLQAEVTLSATPRRPGPAAIAGRGFEVRPHHQRRAGAGWRRAGGAGASQPPTPSASAAGTTAPTWA